MSLALSGFLTFLGLWLGYKLIMAVSSDTLGYIIASSIIAALTGFILLFAALLTYIIL